MQLQQDFGNVTRNMHFHAPANAKAPRSLFLPGRYRHPVVPLPIVDAEVIELHAPKRIPHRRHVHLSRSMHEALLKNEKVVGVGSFHIMYLVYTGLFSFFLYIAAIPLGVQMQASAREVAAFLAAYQSGAEIDFVGLAQALAALGYYHVAQFLLLISSGDLDWLLGHLDYASVHKFFLSSRWFTVPAALLRSMSALYLAFRLLRLWTTEIVVTNDRLLYKHGIFIVRTLKTRLSQLDRVDVNQTWLGNLLGYGSIHVFTHDWETLSGSQISAKGIFLPAIAHPQRLSSLIDRCRGELRHTQAAPPVGADPVELV